MNLFDWLIVTLLGTILEAKKPSGLDEEDYEDICPFPWQTHEQNILSQYAQCNEFENEGVRCTLSDPIECTGRNPVCVFSKHTGDYRCCSDVPQDLSNPPGIPEQVKPICPYGASSYDIPSVMLCDPTEENACPQDYTCEQAVNHQMLTTYNMHLCCKTSTLDSFENVFYETKVGINKMSSNLSMPIFYVTSLSPSIIPVAPSSGVDYIVLNEFIATKGPLPEIRTGDHFSMLPYKLREPTYLSKVVLLHEQFPGYYHHVLLLFNPHGNPESMNFYYNRPSSLSREIELAVPAWDEGVFFRNINRVLTIQNDQTSTKTTRKLYIVLANMTITDDLKKPHNAPPKPPPIPGHSHSGLQQHLHAAHPPSHPAVPPPLSQTPSTASIPSKKSEPGRTVELNGHVGFDSLPHQLVKKCVEAGFQFNLMCVGETGMGKTTLIESLFNMKLDFQPCNNELKTVELRTKTYDVAEGGVRVKLRLVETAGFGDQLDKDKSAQVIVDYLESQFERYLQEELKVRRMLAYMDDTRIHACLYFISPTGHGLKALDIVTLRELSKRVNVIPVIAKADTTCKDELARFKNKVFFLKSCFFVIFLKTLFSDHERTAFQQHQHLPVPH
ncbi:hypothetical protein WR25_19989 [Diploscapter pachys]|uniref:Septin-type G domain-containing protein n=1 Tax=Diploscapter pachys TaxID=2018661 RepID=A0A2A2KVC7_9BILA|nr:hypothetical protein WR25_19989 [Diploscapter pachys]